MWASASDGGRQAPTRLGVVVVTVIAAAAAVFLVLPAPQVAAKLNLLARAGDGGSIGVPGALAGDSGSPSQLSRPGTPSGPTRVGGYLGFAGSLNTALRGTLGNTVVMLVRAQRPSYWVGETFNTWNGESWSATNSATHALHQQSPFILPISTGSTAPGQTDLQTFYVVNSTANLVFHAQSATELWFPASKIYDSTDGTIVSPIAMGNNAIYSVESEVTTPTAGELRAAQSGEQLPAAVEASSLQLPHAYPRVEALAKKITAGDTTNYDKVESLIAWMGAHTRYSTDIPPLPAGADTVDEFLFGNRVGFCEQISTSLAVMLRSIGVPTREAVGYVPGPYNPITDLYQVRASDAHAWVQVWFPGFGWQSFDPTAVVPLANPAPGTVALDDIGHALRRIPIVPVAGALLSLALVATFLHWRRSRPFDMGGADRAQRRAGGPAGRASPPPPRDIQRVRHHPGRPDGDRIGGVAGAGGARGGERATAATIRRPKHSVKWSGAPGGSAWAGAGSGPGPGTGPASRGLTIATQPADGLGCATRRSRSLGCEDARHRHRNGKHGAGLCHASARAWSPGDGMESVSGPCRRSRGQGSGRGATRECGSLKRTLCCWCCPMTRPSSTSAGATAAFWPRSDRPPFSPTSARSHPTRFVSSPPPGQPIGSSTRPSWEHRRTSPPDTVDSSSADHFATIRSCDPLWTDLGVGYTHCGPVGMASVMKLVSNLLLITGVASLAEAIATARGHGVSDELLQEVFGESPVISLTSAIRLKSVIDPNHPGWFSPTLARKDLRLAVGLAQQAGLPVRVGPATDALLTTVVESGEEWPDFSAVIEALS